MNEEASVKREEQLERRRSWKGMKVRLYFSPCCYISSSSGSKHSCNSSSFTCALLFNINVSLTRKWGVKKKKRKRLLEEISSRQSGRHPLVLSLELSSVFSVTSFSSFSLRIFSVTFFYILFYLPQL